MDTARPVSPDTSSAPDFLVRAGTFIRQAGERLDSAMISDREQLRPLRIVPEEMRRLGDYLARRQLKGVKLDAERAIVARPVVALLVAAAVGWAAGRAIRS